MQRRFGEPPAMECSICSGEFREPRILPCGHTFCTSCLQQLIGPIDVMCNQSVKCPQCSESLAVPSTGAQGFPSDVTMINALTSSRAVQRRSSLTQERIASPSGNNQPEVNDAWGGYKYIIVCLGVAFIIAFLFNASGEKRDFSLSGNLKSILNITTEYGHLTMSLSQNDLFVFNPVTSKGEIRDRTTLKTKSSWTLSNFYSISGKSFCKENKYMYVYVSTTNNTILKFDSDGDIVAKWSTGDIRVRPSLTVDYNVSIVPHDNTTRILIYTHYGDLIDTIQLDMSIGGARLNCAVQLPNRRFLVSYGTDSDKRHGVSLTDSKGKVLRSFGGIKGKGTGRVNGPYDLIVEKNGNVFVVDHNNDRILRLSSDLKYLGEILSVHSWLRFPHGAIFDEKYRRLFVMGSIWNDTTSSYSPGKIFVFENQ